MRASELHDQADAPVANESEAKRSYLKTHANYWKSRLEHRTYTHDGKTFEVAELSVRIYFKGLRKSFDLETANRGEAAAKARDIYLSLIAKGWAATLADLSPPAMLPVDAQTASPTVGEFLAEVQRTSNLKPKTFRRYGHRDGEFDPALAYFARTDAIEGDESPPGATRRVLRRSIDQGGNYRA